MNTNESHLIKMLRCWRLLGVMAVIPSFILAGALAAQSASEAKPEAPAEKTSGQKGSQAPKVDRDALRKEAKARREAERTFSAQSVPPQPFQQSHFPENF